MSARKVAANASERVAAVDATTERKIKPFLYEKGNKPGNKPRKRDERAVFVGARCKNRNGRSLVPRRYTTEHTVYILTKEGKNLVRNPKFRKQEFCKNNFVPDRAIVKSTAKKK